MGRGNDACSNANTAGARMKLDKALVQVVEKGTFHEARDRQRDRRPFVLSKSREGFLL